MLLAVGVATGGDRLLTGGLVHGPDGVVEAALRIRDGRIVALVPGGEVEASPGDEVVDLAGAHVLPGLIDAHVHVAGYGAALEQVDLTGARSWAEVVRRAADAAADRPVSEWIEGRGWDQNLWSPSTFPDRRELDQALLGRRVLLRRVDGHAAVASAAALAAAGVGRDTTDPPGGKILRRDDGEPTGVLVDAAVDLVRRVVPAPDDDAIGRRIVTALEGFARVGLTQVHDAGTTARELSVMRRLAAADRLPIRVYVLLDGTDAGLLDRELAAGPTRSGPAMLRVGGVKLYADGALGSRGALLGSDYADDPGNSGLAVSSPETLTAIVQRAARAGFQVGIHAIGDEAVHRSLDAFATIDPRRNLRLRHRIEHSQVIRPADVARFATVQVIASVQPTHCTSDMPWAGERLGRERIAWAYRWRTLLDARAAMAGGSDAPVEDPDPRRGLWAAVTRRRPDGSPPGGWNPGERLSPTEALSLFTEWAAAAGHSERWSGAIRPGAAADLTMVDGNPVEGEPERLLQIAVLRTVVDGRDVWVARSGRTAGGE